jgi:hypothetical protein
LVEEEVREVSVDEPVPEFQPGDVVEVSIPIEHAANLDAVKVAFGHEEYPRDVRFELEGELSADEEQGTSMATFTLLIPPQDRWRGEYKMTMLRVDTFGGRKNVLVEDAPVIRFKIVPERTGHLRANGFNIHRLT